MKQATGHGPFSHQNFANVNTALSDEEEKVL